MKGQKTGGRAVGTPNKVTKELRDVLKGIVAQELATVETTLATLPAKDRIELVLKLLPYCMPKIDSIGGQYDSERFGWS